MLTKFQEELRDQLIPRVSNMTKPCTICGEQKWHNQLKLVGIPVFENDPRIDQTLSGYLPSHAMVCTECGHVSFFVDKATLEELRQLIQQD